MANELTLPDDYAAKLMAGIAESRASTKTAGFGGKDLLRLIEGAWVFGQSNEDVQPGSRWAVNVMSFQHGWTCWVDTGKKNELLGNKMVPVTEPKPVEPAPINGTGWKETVSFDLKCLDGADKGTELHYKINSDGGVRATLALLGRVFNQVAVNKRFPCPVITLESESYHHPKWNKLIHKPIFVLTGWASMQGDVEGEAAPRLDAAPEPAKPPRQRKPPVQQAGIPLEYPLEDAAVPAEATQPVSTTQARVGQRRRPLAR